MSYAILLIEDEATLARNVGRHLRRKGLEVRLAATGAGGLAQLDAFKPDLVLLDFNLPDMDGLAVLSRIRESDPQLKVIIITGHGNIEIAVEAMKAGAHDFLTKPLSLRGLELLIEKTIRQNRIEGAFTYYRDRQAHRSGLDKIIGHSPAIRQLKARIRKLLKAEQGLKEGALPPALILGETGTGKGLVARALHFEGTRRNGPFVEINCASIPSALVESELFGHERGAFTGATRRKEGLVEAASGGTLFLDEVGELEQGIQAKLLRLLEEGSVRRVGSVRDRPIDVRIVAATNRPLETMVREGRFRADLYYRLCVVTLVVPPLRERGDDVGLLATHFLEHAGRRYGRHNLRLGAAALALIRRHDWPGNVRELRNVIEQAVLLSSGEVIEAGQLAIGGHDLQPGGNGLDTTGSVAEENAPASDRLADAERALIVRALEQTQGNVTQAARALGISRDQLRYRMAKHDLR